MGKEITITFVGLEAMDADALYVDGKLVDWDMDLNTHRVQFKLKELDLLGKPVLLESKSTDIDFEAGPPEDLESIYDETLSREDDDYEEDDEEFDFDEEEES